MQKKFFYWMMAAILIICGVLMQGELTIIGQDGKKKVVHEGEAVVEMVNTVHHGENRGTKPVVLYMFYLSQKDMPLSVQQ